MGLHHHKEQNYQKGPGLFSYSAGWRWTDADGNRYCSVMSYSSGSYFEDGNTHTRVAYFSNPNVLHGSIPTGDDSDGDNARTLREIKHVIADYRPTAGTELVACKVDTPEWPNGITYGIPYKSYKFEVDEIECSVHPGHKLEYNFWNGRCWTGWSTEPSVEISFPASGSYHIIAVARCPVTLTRSDFSASKLVRICSVTAPGRPYGTDSGPPDKEHNYHAHGASCSCRSGVQYRFDWGDGTFSNWKSPASGTTYASASKSWPAVDIYQLRAQARCQNNHSAVSPWSQVLNLDINEDDLRYADDVIVIIDRESLETDTPARIYNGRTMVPLRAIFETLKIKVYYNAETGTITGTRGDINIQLTVGSTLAKVDGKKVSLDVPATVIEGRTLVPVRFISESTGQNVSWDAATRRVIITTD